MHTHNSLVLALLCISVTTQAQILTYSPTVTGADPDTIVYEAVLDEEIILDCGYDSTGMIPLNDLGTGYYLDYEGGLFKEGSNSPTAAHLDKGKKIANNLKKRDDFGNIDEANGTIMMIGMGASVASDAFNTFRDTMLAQDWPGVNPCLEVKSVFIGGKDMGDILDPDQNYWGTFQDRLDAKFIDPDQVQVAWMLMQSEATTHDVESYVTYVIGQYKLILADMLDEMPNLRIVFLSGMHYTGYTAPSHERYDAMVEPKGYWGNLAIRELINQQMDGDPDLDFEGADRKVPYITWGPYFWADGTNPRADGLSWSCEEFRSDSTGGGFHLKEEYQYKEGDMIYDFLTTNDVAKLFFNDGPKWAACGTGRYGNAQTENGLNIFPNPASELITVQLPATLTGTVDVAICDGFGRLLYQRTVQAETTSGINLAIADYPSGFYYCIVKSDAERYTGMITKQ